MAAIRMKLVEKSVTLACARGYDAIFSWLTECLNVLVPILVNSSRTNTPL